MYPVGASVSSIIIVSVPSPVIVTGVMLNTPDSSVVYSFASSLFTLTVNFAPASFVLLFLESTLITCSLYVPCIDSLSTVIVIFPVVLSIVTGLLAVITCPSLSVTVIVVFSTSITFIPFSIFFATSRVIVPSNLLYPLGA